MCSVDIEKANILGKGYIIDEILYHLNDKAKKRKELKRLSSYICKSLQLIPQGKYLVDDVFTIFDNKVKVERTAEEIVKDVVERAGLKVLRNGN